LTGSVTRRSWMPVGNRRVRSRRLFPPRECPRCGAALGRGAMQRREALTLRGEVRYERAVFECPRCRLSHAPLDRELGACCPTIT